MLDMIQMDIDILNMRFEYSNTNMVSDVNVKYPDLDTDEFKLLYRIRTRIRLENIRTICTLSSSKQGLSIIGL